MARWIHDRLTGDPPVKGVANAPFREQALVNKITASERFGPIMRRVKDWLDRPVKTGKPLTKKQGEALIDYIRSQAGPVYGQLLEDEFEARNYKGMLTIIRELTALDLEEHKAGKKVVKKNVKPTLVVHLPGVAEAESE